MAVILPGCEIADGATIAAGAVLSKGTRVGPGEVWAGVPARRVGSKHGVPGHDPAEDGSRIPDGQSRAVT
jgi:acetyltransferase-like isoleucine patch superfamily enzyme